MVSEEDCPLQECECAELPHQVSPVFFSPNAYFFRILLFNFSNEFRFTTLCHSNSFHLIPPPPIFLPVFGASIRSLVVQLEGWPGSVCSHP